MKQVTTSVLPSAPLLCVSDDTSTGERLYLELDMHPALEKSGSETSEDFRNSEVPSTLDL